MQLPIKLIILLISLSYSLSVYAGESSDRDPTIGGVEFERSCAVCHGFDGKGNGVMSDSLTKKPADLTMLTKNNNGHFPFSEIYRVIDGSPEINIHGSRDMPLWGDRYRKEAKDYADRKYAPEIYDTNERVYARGLILELIVYINSIQEK